MRKAGGVGGGGACCSRMGEHLEVRVGDAAGDLAEQRAQHARELRRRREFQQFLQLGQEQHLRRTPRSEC